MLVHLKLLLYNDIRTRYYEEKNTKNSWMLTISERILDESIFSIKRLKRLTKQQKVNIQHHMKLYNVRNTYTLPEKAFECEANAFYKISKNTGRTFIDWIV